MAEYRIRVIPQLLHAIRDNAVSARTLRPEGGNSIMLGLPHGDRRPLVEVSANGVDAVIFGQRGVGAKDRQLPQAAYWRAWHHCQRDSSG